MATERLHRLRRTDHTARILEVFTGVARHQLAAPDGSVLRTFQPELTDLQHQVLDLLNITARVYNPERRRAPEGCPRGAECALEMPVHSASVLIVQVMQLPRVRGCAHDPRKVLTSRQDRRPELGHLEDAVVRSLAGVA